MSVKYNNANDKCVQFQPIKKAKFPYKIHMCLISAPVT